MIDKPDNGGWGISGFTTDLDCSPMHETMLSGGKYLTFLGRTHSMHPLTSAFCSETKNDALDPTPIKAIEFV